jgi:hypothetical protein
VNVERRGSALFYQPERFGVDERTKRLCLRDEKENLCARILFLVL